MELHHRNNVWVEDG
jgi:hypothetical protein